MKLKRNKQSGFTLIELLIVVSIILIIAAIAIPKLLSARAQASQSNAAASMRSVNTALTMYYTAYGSFPATVEVLGGPSPCTQSATTFCALDDTISSLITAGTYNNYTWTYTPTASPVGFTLTAAPAAGNTATRYFYDDQGGTLHYADGAAATATSAALGN
jgi:prepilin-type N-terminal cleavage/methylation domain-containing protein